MGKQRGEQQLLTAIQPVRLTMFFRVKDNNKAYSKLPQTS